MRFLAIILVAGCVGVCNAEEIVVNVLVNGMDRGDHIATLSGGKVSLDPSDIGIETKSLSDQGVAYSFDMDEMRLIVAANPALLRPQEIDLKYADKRSYETPQDSTVFVNYDASVTRTEETSSRVLLEGGGYVGGVVPIVRAHITDNGGKVDEVSVSKEKGTLRATVGDFYAPEKITGVQLRRNLLAEPYESTLPEITASGVKSEPGTMLIKSNGFVIASRKMDAGPYTIRNIPVPFGASVLSVDNTYQRIYSPRTLLRKGLIDFSAGFGLSDGRPATSGFFRYGVASGATVGGVAAAHQGDLRIGGELNFVPFRLAEVSASASTGTQGTEWRVLAERQAFRYGVYGSVGNLRGQLIASVRARLYSALIGNIGFGYGIRDDVRLASLTLTRNIGPVFVYASAETGTYTNVYATLSYFLNGHDISAGTRVNDEVETFLRVRKSLPRGPGAAYSATARVRDGVEGGDLHLAYNADSARIFAEAMKLGDRERQTVRLAGAVSYLDGFHLSRPVRSYLLVRVPGIEGVPVTVDGTYYGKTNRNGELVVPDLLPYYTKVVRIDTSALPVDIEVERTVARVRLGYRQGGTVTFPVKTLSAVYGTLTLDGKPLGMAAIDVGGAESVTGRNGEFYIEGLPIGEHKGKAQSPGQECAFTLTVKPGLFDAETVPCRRVP